MLKSNQKFNPSILEGISRMADINGVFNDHFKVKLGDLDFSLFTDWEVIGQDLSEAIQIVLVEDGKELDE